MPKCENTSSTAIFFFRSAKQQFQVPDYIRAKAQGFKEEEQIKSYTFLAEFPSLKSSNDAG